VFKKLIALFVCVGGNSQHSFSFGFQGSAWGRNLGGAKKTGDKITLRLVVDWFSGATIDRSYEFTIDTAWRAPGRFHSSSLGRAGNTGAFNINGEGWDSCCVSDLSVVKTSGRGARALTVVGRQPSAPEVRRESSCLLSFLIVVCFVIDVCCWTICWS
jgi:hypothetical protein